MSVATRVMNFGSFTIDLDSHELFKRGRRLKIQEKPFLVLATLVQHPGEVVLKGSLQEVLWPTSNIDPDQGLDTAVRKLRRVLDDSPARPRYVETVRGRGYRFIGSLTESSTQDLQIPGKLRQCHRIAVLPFLNLTSDPEQAWFCDGLTEETIAVLSRISGLEVVARTSVFQFKGKDGDVRRIGRALRATVVLEGSFRAAGDHARITAQAVRTSDGMHLWADSYDVPMASMRDSLEVQEHLATGIAAALGVQLRPNWNKALQYLRPKKPEAYWLYARGRALWAKRHPVDLIKAISIFEQAITLDPEYALAHVALCECYDFLAIAGFPTSEVLPKAMGAAVRALELAPRLAEAHAALGATLMMQEHNYPLAMRHFCEAIELDAGLVNTHCWYANLLLVTGRSRDAVAHAEKASQLEPGATVVSAHVGKIFYFAGEYQRAAKILGETLEIDQNYFPALWPLGMLHAAMRRYEEAISVLEAAAKLSGRNPQVVATLGYVQGIKGDLTAANQLLNEVRDASMRQYVSPINMAIALAGLGEVEKCVAELERAHAENALFIDFVPFWPIFADVVKDHRCADFLHKVRRASSQWRSDGSRSASNLNIDR